MRKRALPVAAVAVALFAAGGVAVANAGTVPAHFSQALEAETDGIPGNGVHAVACSPCSGGERVTGLGGHQDGDLLFYVEIPQEGDYTVTISYVSAHGHALSLNGKVLTGLDSHGRVASRSVRVHLTTPFHRAASVDLGYDTKVPAVDVDKVVVRSVTAG